MKTLICLLFLFFTSTLFAQTTPAEPVNLWHLIWTVIIPIIAGLYEVIVRIIPTVNNYSFIGKIIEILLWLSNFFNNKKKK